MKCIPAGLFLAILCLASPHAISQADESAQELATKDGLNGSTTDDESAGQLAADQGLNPGDSQDESAGALATQDGLTGSSADDESASALADQTGVGEVSANDDESAAALAESEKLETKPKVDVSGPTTSTFAPGEGVDGTVYAVAAQADNKVVIGGNFNNVDGQPRNNIARIDKNGSVDMTFETDPENGVDGTIYALAIDAKGNIYAGGYFSQPKNSDLKNLIRYTPAGKIDPTFTASLCPNGTVYALAVQPDGTVVIGGEFSEVGDSPRRNLAKIAASGKLAGPVDAPEGVSGTVRALVSHPAGPVFAGGQFQAGSDAARNVINVPGN